MGSRSRGGRRRAFPAVAAGTLAVAVALAAARDHGGRGGLVRAGGVTRAGLVFTLVLAVIFLARAVGDSATSASSSRSARIHPILGQVAVLAALPGHRARRLSWPGPRTLSRDPSIAGPPTARCDPCGARVLRPRCRRRAGGRPPRRQRHANRRGRSRTDRSSEARAKRRDDAAGGRPIAIATSVRHAISRTRPPGSSAEHQADAHLARRRVTPCAVTTASRRGDDRRQRAQRKEDRPAESQGPHLDFAPVVQRGASDIWRSARADCASLRSRGRTARGHRPSGRERRAIVS